MLRKVSVEGGLDQVRKRLIERGYEVVDMENCIRPVEAVVFNGGGGVNSVSSHGPEGTILLNAQGLSPDAVADRLDSL